MTDKSIAGIATLLEETFPGTYLRKNHNGLVQTLMCYMGPYKAQDVVEIIKDYAENYENTPSVGTLIKLLKERQKGVTIRITKKYIEDNDGCGYLYNDKEGDYDCIWKWWWADRGMSKMQVLRKHRLIDY